MEQVLCSQTWSIMLFSNRFCCFFFAININTFDFLMVRDYTLHMAGAIKQNCFIQILFSICTVQFVAIKALCVCVCVVCVACRNMLWMFDELDDLPVFGFINRPICIGAGKRVKHTLNEFRIERRQACCYSMICMMSFNGRWYTRHWIIQRILWVISFIIGTSVNV